MNRRNLPAANNDKHQRTPTNDITNLPFQPHYFQMNRQMNLPALQRTMMEFQKQSEAMEMKQEMVGDSIEDAMDEEEDEEETNMLVQQTLDSLGLQLGNEMVDAPSGGTTVVAPVVEDKEDKELEARLNNLKR
jgi:charged multivesicular body protein 2A